MSNIKEIEELKELKQRVEKLNEKIIQYSVYPSKALATSFAKLLTTFGQQTFHVSTEHSNIYSIYYNYYGQHFIFSLYNNALGCSKYIKVSKEQTVFCPIGYKGIASYYRKQRLPMYIYDFIDYAFQQRVEKNIVNITEEELDVIVEDYIKNVKEKQAQKAKTKEQIEKEKQRISFEKTCMVDRESIFYAIESIITKSDEKAYSGVHYGKQKDKTKKESTFLVTNSLYILLNGRLKDYRILLDTVQEQEEDKVVIDKNKVPYINFFDLKNYFSYAYENLDCFHNFMDDVESLYQDRKTVGKKDIELLLSREKENNKVKMKTE